MGGGWAEEDGPRVGVSGLLSVPAFASGCCRLRKSSEALVGVEAVSGGVRDAGDVVEDDEEDRGGDGELVPFTALLPSA